MPARAGVLSTEAILRFLEGRDLVVGLAGGLIGLHIPGCSRWCSGFPSGFKDLEEVFRRWEVMVKKL